MASSNAKYTVNGSKLIIEIDMNADLGASKSGKTNMVASSGGFEKIDGTNLSVSLNVIRPLAK